MAVEIIPSSKTKRLGSRQRRIGQVPKDSSPPPPAPAPPPPAKTTVKGPTAAPNRHAHHKFISGYKQLSNETDTDCFTCAVMGDVTIKVLSTAQIGESANPGMTAPLYSKSFRDGFKWKGGDLRIVLSRELDKVIAAAGEYVTDRILQFKAWCLIFAGKDQQKMLRAVLSYGEPQVGMCATQRISKGRTTTLFAVLNWMSLRSDSKDQSSEDRDPLSRMITRSYTFETALFKSLGDFFMGNGPLQCINHSCVPNSEFRYTRKLVTFVDTSGKEVKRFVRVVEAVAIRDIKPGEEITVFYADGYFGHKNWKCKCPDRKHPSRPPRGTEQARQADRRATLDPSTSLLKANLNHKVDPRGRTRGAKKAAAGLAVPAIPDAPPLVTLAVSASSAAPTGPIAGSKPRQSRVRFDQSKAQENVDPLISSNKSYEKRKSSLRMPPISELDDLESAKVRPVNAILKGRHSHFRNALSALATIANNIL